MKTSISKDISQTDCRECPYCDKLLKPKGYGHHVSRCSESEWGCQADADRFELEEYEEQLFGQEERCGGGAEEVALPEYARTHAAEIELLLMARDYNLPRRAVNELLVWEKKAQEHTAAAPNAAVNASRTAACY
jgi:hypothetical protein